MNTTYSHSKSHDRNDMSARWFKPTVSTNLMTMSVCIGDDRRFSYSASDDPAATVAAETAEEGDGGVVSGSETVH